MSYRAHIAALMTAVFVVALAVPASATQAASRTATTTAPSAIAADRTIAQAINLAASDLPGWQESPNPPNSTAGSFVVQLAKCTGNPAITTNDDVMDVTSADFSKGPIQLSSDVTMVHSHADALSDKHVLTDPKILGCVDSVSKREFSGQLPPGERVSYIKSSIFTPSQVISGSFGLRSNITLVVKENGITRTISFVANQIDFLVGRAEVSLQEFETGKAVPVTAEAALLQTLDSRAVSLTAGQGGS